MSSLNTKNDEEAETTSSSNTTATYQTKSSYHVQACSRTLNDSTSNTTMSTLDQLSEKCKSVETIVVLNNYELASSRYDPDDYEQDSRRGSMDLSMLTNELNYQETSDVPKCEKSFTYLNRFYSSSCEMNRQGVEKLVKDDQPSVGANELRELALSEACRSSHLNCKLDEDRLTSMDELKTFE